LALFNSAAVSVGDDRFLGFYRVLEYYFQRASVQELGRLRRDPTISDDEFLSQLRFDRELPQLQALLRSVLTTSEASSFVEYAKYHKLSAAKTLKEFAEHLYRYRNSLVHAKESQIQTTRVPDPFSGIGSTGSWEWIVELAAARSIRRMSKHRSA
jgi:hypothetical protein